jgi:hypothetical protein
MSALIGVGILFWIMIYIALSVITAAWAENKGRSAGGFFMLSLVLSPIVGLIAAGVARPNVARLEKLMILDATHKRCPDCAELVKADALKCRYCGADVSGLQVGLPGAAGYRDGRAVEA